MAEHKNPNLKNKVVFTHRREVLGIPEKIFFSLCALCVFAAFVFCAYLGWSVGAPLSVALVVLVFVPVYLVHKEDHDAYSVWMRSLITPSRLTASRIKPRRLVLLTWDGERSQTTSLSKKGTTE
ncbi:hypothetical protein RE428_48820 (plasmid) [Marinobacter nanhaiticus D15-8W]|nr:hypothetical protein [Marinobacter nanhaiticus]BES73864.1 hypothetical protein RE428_48820 [Marinobacter nanhaiticus D15-8W]